MGETIAIQVKRTGRKISIAGSEFEITYPNGCTETVWSPPWHDFDPVLEEAGALKWGAARWAEVVDAWIKGGDQ